MEGALFIGEDLDLLRRALARAEQDVERQRALVQQIADDFGICLDHAGARRECGCGDGEASNASAAQRPPDSSVAETPEEEH